jgi:two-component system LytT family response regulator
VKAIAIDDEPIALSVIRSHAAKVPFLELDACFTDAFEAADYLQREAVDLLFLDIKMPDISGIEFLNSLSRKPLVIFTTAYSEHAVQSFELDAVDYLLKPFSLARFIKGCNKAAELFKVRNVSAPPDFFYVKTGYEQVKLRYDDILYLESAGNYVNFILRDRQLLSRSTFADLSAQLPAERFIRVHRSFMVALDKIDALDRQQLRIGRHQVPIGESYSQNLHKALQAR